MDSKGIEGLEDGRSEARDRVLTINSESYGTIAYYDVVLTRHLLWWLSLPLLVGLWWVL